MRRSLYSTAILLAVALGGWWSCSRARGPHDAFSTTTTTGAQFITHDAAVTGLSDARCARATSCGELGALGRYVTAGACTDRTKRELNAALPSARCPAIAPERLDGCIAAIRGEVCSQPLDAVTSLPPCAAATLCGW